MTPSFKSKYDISNRVPSGRHTPPPRDKCSHVYHTLLITTCLRENTPNFAPRCNNLQTVRHKAFLRKLVSRARGGRCFDRAGHLSDFEMLATGECRLTAGQAASPPVSLTVWTRASRELCHASANATVGVAERFGRHHSKFSYWLFAK